MPENVKVTEGKQSLQPCHVCTGIKIAGELQDGWTICPRCFAEWESHPGEVPLRDMSPAGCYIALGIIVMCVIALGYSCRGGWW